MINPVIFSSYLKCLHCEAGEVEYFFLKKDTAGESGFFACRQCRRYYRLENDILDCLPGHIVDCAATAAFEEKFHEKLKSFKSRIPDFSEKEKTKEFVFEEAIPETYDLEIVDTAFWKKVLGEVLKKWKESLERVKPEIILDIGCGTGRLSNHFAELGNQVIALDVTFPMLEIAQKKAKKLGVAANVQYVLGDINNLPFKPQSIAALSFFGVFHHLESPYKAFEMCLKILSSKSLILGVDNNGSVFRKIFDAMMKIRPLWHEDDHLEHAALSSGKFLEILRKHRYKTDFSTTCFIPPQFYSFLPAAFSDSFYEAGDAIGKAVLKNQGGLLCIQAERP